MRMYRKMALWSIVSTYFLIFIGGLVRVSGAGLGCPDWPKCFGRWIPPFNASQLPPGFDPSTFNFTLAWIEYINRLVGVFVGFVILATAIFAVIYFRNKLSVLAPSLLAALLVAFQGWQGSRVVASELEPIIISAHTIIALIIVSLLIFASLEAYFYTDAEKKMGVFSKKTPQQLLFLWGATILQVLLGIQVRQSIEESIRTYPLLFDAPLIAKIGPVDEIHMSLGIIVVLLLLFSIRQLLKQSDSAALLIRQSAWAALGIGLLQIIIGYFLLIIGLAELVQLLHLWLASLLLGLLLILYVAIKKGGTFVEG